MEKQECRTAGGNIERGRIKEITDGGYRVENLDRAGLNSRVITGCDETEYAVEDMVLFVMFRDGTGKIFCKA